MSTETANTKLVEGAKDMSVPGRVESENWIDTHTYTEILDALTRYRRIEATARDYVAEAKQHGDRITKYSVRQALYTALNAKP